MIAVKQAHNVLRVCLFVLGFLVGGGGGGLFNCYIYKNIYIIVISLFII